MSKTGCIISHEGIEYLCGLIRELSHVSEGIDNINIADDKTFSSTKIITLLTTLQNDCNKYTDSIVANLSRLELRVVTNESEMTEHNKLYLYKAPTETSYTQYVIVTNDSGVNEKISLGTCDIEMSDYLKIIDAQNTYVLKTDFNTLTTEVTNIKKDIGNEDISSVGTSVKDAINELNTNKEENSNKVTTIDSTSTDTQYPSALAVKTELDKKIDKSSITTTIDYSSTDNQVPSAKSIYYNCIEGIEINQTTIDTYGTEILKYPLGIWRISSDDLASKFTDLPVKSSGRIEITSIEADTNKNPLDNTWSYRVYNFESYTGENYIRKITSANTAGVFSYDTGWQKVCTTNVSDVPLTTIAFQKTTNYKIPSQQYCEYLVVNGECEITLRVNVVDPSNIDTPVFSGLPVPYSIKYFHLACTEGTGNDHIFATVYTDGRLLLKKGTVNGLYIGSFKYKVVES